MAHDGTAKKAVAIFAVCSSNGGQIFVFVALFLRNNLVKFKKIPLIRIMCSCYTKTYETYKQQVSLFQGSTETHFHAVLIATTHILPD